MFILVEVLLLLLFVTVVLMFALGKIESGVLLLSNQTEEPACTELTPCPHLQGLDDICVKSSTDWNQKDLSANEAV